MDSVESSLEASGFLVVPLVFKTSERRAASLAGSIPVRLRYLHAVREPDSRGNQFGQPSAADHGVQHASEWLSLLWSAGQRARPEDRARLAA